MAEASTLEHPSSAEDAKMSEITPGTAPAGTHSEASHPATTTGLSHNKLMMWLFLGSECLLFGALISTYMFAKSRLPDGEIGPSDVFDIPFTSVSSFVLLMSSLTMVLALSAMQRSNERGFRVWITATALLGAPSWQARFMSSPSSTTAVWDIPPIFSVRLFTRSRVFTELT